MNAIARRTMFAYFVVAVSSAGIPPTVASWRLRLILAGCWTSGGRVSAHNRALRTCNIEQTAERRSSTVLVVTIRPIDSLAAAVDELLVDILACTPTRGDTLRDQGMDSMASTRLWLELRTRLGVELPLDWLAAEADRDKLVARIAEQRAAGPCAIAEHLRVVPDPECRTDPFPLTAMQQSYLLGMQPECTIDPVGCDQYLEIEVYDLDVERLTGAWRRLVERHDMLRTVVTAEGMQRVVPPAPDFTIGIHDLRALASDVAARKVVDVRRRILERRDADAGRPTFAIEVSLHEPLSVVHLAVDMRITDGHGLAILLAEWRACYDDPAATLRELDLSARDCVLALCERLRGAEHRDDLAWWTERLHALPPGPRVVAAQPGPRGVERRSLNGVLSQKDFGALRDQARAQNVSLSALVLAVFAHTLGSRSRDDAFSMIVTTNLRVVLPEAANQLVGPFTSAAIIVARGARQAIAGIASEVQRQLWDALQHSGASCVDVLRELRSRGSAAVASPVVFTSLIGVGPGGRQDVGFGADVTFGACRTSEVALELAIWEHDGELRFRWDVAAGRFTPGDPEIMFAGFANALRAVTAGMTATHRPLNDLQQAYYVARASAPDTAWNGCQIYASFEAAELDPRALEGALTTLVDHHEALRTNLTADGRLAVWRSAPTSWTLPVLELGASADATAIRDDMAGRAFALGAWPAFEVRLTRWGGRWTVHCAFDLAILDARSIHLLCRALFAPRRLGMSRTSLPPVASVAASYWHDRLAQLPAGPALLAGEERARVRHHTRVAGWSQLKALAVRHGVTPDTLLLAAFLDALAGELCDRAFAVPVVRFPDSEDPQHPGELTALSWVEHVAVGTLLDKAAAYHRIISGDAAAARASGLPELRRRILRERSGGGEFGFPVVYTTIVDLDDAPLPPAITQGTWLSCTPDVSLDCIAIREADELFVCWDGVAADFVRGQLESMFASYRRTVELLAHSQDAPRSAPDREQILYEWNATSRPFPRDRLVHQYFEHHAARAPGALALRGKGWTRSYGELNREANRIAQHLTSLGVGPEKIVGVAIRRGPDMVAACLGILKAGGAYLPVEPALPAERVALLLSQAHAAVVLTLSGSLPWPVPAGTRVVEIDDLPDDTAVCADPERRACPGNLAYVIFTSGSTGTPKGVAVAHRAVVNLLQWCHRTFGFGPDDTGLCVTPLGFDLSVFDLFGILGSGGALYLADEVERADPQVLLDVLLSERITFWNSAPAVLGHMVPLLPSVRGRPGTDALRLVFLSGDRMPLPLPGELRAAFPGAQLVNLGGATEATVWSNAFVVGEVDPSWRSVPYGKPIDNARYHVLDDQGEPCPPGMEGELYIGGDCLAEGYYGRPDLTADRFVPDPFARQPGQRLYRTGDRATYLADGVLCFLGRRDRQLKIRGFRIELEEIEHRLRRHPGVHDAVVFARPDPSGDSKLVAYVIAAPAMTVDVQGLRAFAGQALPDYMVPNFVVLVDAFPTTTNGKLDRDALPWPPPDPRETAPAAEAAQLADEIASLFAGLLGVPRFAPSQDIWYQGATSFTVVQVSHALHERYGHRIPVSAVIAEPTAEGIARWLAAQLACGTVTIPLATTAPTTPPPVDYFSIDELREFRNCKWSLRPRSPGQCVVVLPPPQIAVDHYTWRSSRRDFSPGPVPRDAFCQLLALLAQAAVGERVRRLYPSAGETYAVQVYFAIRDGGVEGLAPGTYYYHPIDHALHSIRSGAEIDRTVHHSTDRSMFDAAAFELYLIGQSHGIEPIYREQAERYLALEAGHVSQLLMMGQAACGIGLCPIGDLAFARLRDPLRLDDGHRFLLAMMGGRAEWPASSTGVAPAFAALPSSDVAIVGIAGRYPGADDPDALWQQLLAGRTAIGRPPQQRGLTATGSAGFLDRIDEFDSLLFGIAPAEAETLDPQLRLLLETVRVCLDDAGHSPESLQRSAGRVGVVVAAMWQDYQQVGAEAWSRGAEPMVSASASDIAHRISQCFDFRGPSLAVDAACTSSVAAIHLAVDSLRRGECGAMIVGAVNLLAHPYHLGVLAGLGLSASDLRGAFDAEVSGWVPGEGVAAVLLRPAAAALANGDMIHGVIEATALGHSGRAGAVDASVLASSVAHMLAEHNVPRSAVSYVECASAGASVGDAAEIEALARVFGDRAATGPVLIGTLKPNIGQAAGLSQLTKVVLQMRHGQIAPTRLAAKRNPLVAWDALPLQIPDQITAWPPGDAPLRAVVNTLGANGAFGHLVVRAAPPRAASSGADREVHTGEQVVVLSAASRSQLLEIARRLHDRLVASPCELTDLAYTLQTASAELAHRVAIASPDLATLLRRLDAFANGRPLDAAVTGAAAKWLRGESVDWPWPRPGRRVSLPAYPFVRRAHWLSAPRAEALEDQLLQIYADVSGIARQELDPRVPLERYGLSSLLSRRLHARLERELGRVPPTLFYEHDTLAEIAARLQQQSAVPRPVTAARAEPSAGDIAIIGISGRYPQARNVAELWANLAAGRDSITPLPTERRLDGWPIDRMWGGYLDGIDQFDALLFNIAPRDADLSDPQERLFLEVAWEALDDAGYPRTRLRERHASRVGVWVGSMYNEYPFFGVERSLGGEPVSAGAGLADIANRVSYFFDLRGPSMTVDTLCSSSLTSLHLAVESLRRGECEVAIAGGVNLSLHPNKFIEQARHAMPSSDHRCRSFGARGDGFVPGEGVGAVVIKPLHAAIVDGDRIQAIVKATAVNHGGRSNGYMVPSPAAQGEVVRSALAAAGVPASTIGYVEAHGTGTELGDPIEIAGLERAFAGEEPALGHWPIGSVKSSIGHLEGAAGIAGLTKVVLQLRAKAFAPSLHAEELNAAVDWERSRFRVQRVSAPWSAMRGADGELVPRRAGISSFGAGGANAHAIVEEYIAPPMTARPAPGPQLVVLSALDEARLRAVASSLAGHLDAEQPVLVDVAYTLQVGREHLRERLAVVVSSLDELRDALERFAAGDDRCVMRGRAMSGASAAEACDLVVLGR
ncbi:MAG: amino acid adenylation domain-containing protein, partial [Deltaproteobacteria bacterium]